MTASQRRWLRRSPAILVALVMLVLVVRNADVPELPDYEVPEGFTPAPPPAPEPPGGARPALAAVAGTTTTTVPPNVGRARLAGAVSGPGGPVPGATVRLERVVGSATQVLDVLAGPDGRYDAAGIGGGRYRVRAFLAPTHAQPEGEVLFLPDGEERGLDLRVEAFGGPRVAVAHAPEVPLLGDAVGVAVQVTARQVDADGVVASEPIAGATVELTATGGLIPPSSGARVTGADGRADFGFACRSATPTTVLARVRLPGAVPGTPPVTTSVEVPACVDPSTLTTTTTTTTTTTAATAPSSSTALTPTTTG